MCVLPPRCKEGRTEWIELVPPASAPEPSPSPEPPSVSEEGIHAQASQAQDQHARPRRQRPTAATRLLTHSLIPNLRERPVSE
jgi:hypothetical protein